MRSPRLLAALLAAVVVTGLAACSSAPSEPTTVSEQTLSAIEADPGFTWDKQTVPLDLGVTHTQDSLGSHDPEEATDRGKEILADNSAIWQNNHLMGFGTDNPEPSPGDYDWDSLDQRMELTEETGGKAMLTLCCAPDWMKGGDEGETDWSKLEDNPLPEHFADYANLAAEAVKRYPQVDRVLVWNELKGFYNEAANRWDYEGYTDFYNQVYTAVKAVRPDIQVGGPYVVLISLDPGTTDASPQVTGPWGAADQRTLDVIDYWLQNNVGADFLAVDAATNKRDQDGLAPLDGARKYADLARWLQQRTDLPIWWAEYYPEVPAGESDDPASPANAAVNLAAIAAMAESGTAGALLWGPQAHDLGSPALWTDATTDDGGQPLPLTQSWQFLVPRMAAGNVEIGRSPSRPNLLAFRADDGVVVVNLSADATELAPGNELAAWEIKVGGRES